jgi:hypothetical protein
VAVIHNIHTNPALSVDNSPATWFGSGYARITGAHASLPRTTAWSGTGGAPVAGRFSGTPAKYYAVTGSIRFTGASTGHLQVDWKTSGNAYIETTQLTTFSQGAGTTARIGGVAVAPASADHGDIVVNDLTGATQITAMMVREFALEADALAALAVDVLAANYADGDSTGGVWDGTTGKSTSTITRLEPAHGSAEFGALVASGYGIRTSADATGGVIFGPLLASTGLIPSAQYDRRRGRIRVSASGLATSAVRVIIYSRPLGTSRWTVVRGGRIAVVAGALQHPADDYEYRAGGGMEYRIDALDTTEEQPQHVIQSVRITVTDTEEQVWLKFIPAPWTNIPVELVVDDWELQQEARSEVHDVAGTSPPIVVSDVHGSIRTSVRFRTPDAASLAGLRRALGQGAPAYLQVPDSVPFPTMYVSIGNFSSRRWGGRESSRYLTTVDLVEVAAPPPSVVPASLTWGVFSAQFGSWAEASAAYERWSDVVG